VDNFGTIENSAGLLKINYPGQKSSRTVKAQELDDPATIALKKRLENQELKLKKEQDAELK